MILPHRLAAQSPLPKMCDAVIVGAGPAGLAAAEIISASGYHVVLCEAMPSPGRKFLMAGRGGLNLTHSENLEPFLDRYGPARPFLEPMLRAFPPEALQIWAAALGEPCFIGTSGRVFPKSFKASPLLRAWLQRLRQQNVQAFFRHRWLGWADHTPDAFAENPQAGLGLRFQTAQGEETFLQAKTALLALGGASWPRLGSDGRWRPLLEQQGLTITPFRPSNCGFLCSWSDFFTERFAGTPLKNVALTVFDRQNQPLATAHGDLILGAHGIEGSAVYALSAPLRDRLADNPKPSLALASSAAPYQDTACLRLDLKPDLSLETLRARLAKAPAGESLSNTLRKRLALSPAVPSLLKECLAEPETLFSLAAQLKALPLPVTEPAGLERAISTAGGVSLAMLTSDLEVKTQPGLFLAGEMLDWEAPTGGYLLQACFATGRHAGQAMVRSLARLHP